MVRRNNLPALLDLEVLDLVFKEYPSLDMLKLQSNFVKSEGIQCILIIIITTTYRIINKLSSRNITYNM